jgi:hypothetical protein
MKKIVVEPYIEATSKLSMLLASYSGSDVQQGRLLGPVSVPGASHIQKRMSENLHSHKPHSVVSHLVGTAACLSSFESQTSFKAVFTCIKNCLLIPHRIYRKCPPLASLSKRYTKFVTSLTFGIFGTSQSFSNAITTNPT